MPKCFMNVLKDYSSNRLPFICSFQDYYRSLFPISQSGYQPIFYGEVGEVPGVTQDFFIHLAVLVAGLYGLPPRPLSGVVSGMFSILEFLTHSVASLLFSEASLSLLCASSSSYSLTLSGIMSSAFVSSCTWMPCSSTQLPRTSRTSANGWNFFLLM